MNCKTCGRPLNFDQQRSGYCNEKCAKEIDGVPLGESFNQDQSDRREYDRYGILKVLASIFRLFAWIAGLVGIAATLIGLVQIEAGGIMLLFGGLIGGGVGIVVNLTISEGIHLFIDIANDTRRLRILQSVEKNVE